MAIDAAVQELIDSLNISDAAKKVIADQYQAGELTITAIRRLAKDFANAIATAGRSAQSEGVQKAQASRDFYLTLGDFESGLATLDELVAASDNAKQFGLKLEVPRPQWLREITVPQKIKDVLYEQYKAGNITEPGLAELKEWRSAIQPGRYPQASGSFTWQGTLVGDVANALRAFAQYFKDDPLPTGPEADQVRSVVANLGDDQLAAESKKLRDAVAKGGQSVTFMGRTYSLTQARDLIKPLVSEEVQNRAAATGAQNRALLAERIVADRELADAANKKARASRELNTARSDFSRGRITEEQLRAAEKKATDAGVNVVLAQQAATRVQGATPTRQPTPQDAAERIGAQRIAPPTPAMDRAEQVRFQRIGANQAAVQTAQPVAGMGATGNMAGTATPTTGVRTGGTGGAGGAGAAGAGGVGTAGTARPGRVPDNWINVFKREFPQYQYLLDETVFGADMTELLKRAVTEKWYDSEELATLMEQGFGQTTYAQTTTTNQQNFDKLTPGNRLAQIEAQKTVIRDSYGNLQFTDEQLDQLATKAARDGKQGRALELYIFQEALAKPAGATDYSNQLAATRAITSNRADQIRQIGKDYGVPLSQREIEDVLTGKVSEEELRQSYKMAARRWYKGIQEDLDAGLTVEQIFKPYRQYAAAILEKPIDQIDLTDQNGGLSVYADALQGEEGPLSLSDWSRRLKSDPKYGYQYTAQARQEVNNVVGTLEKAFGLTR